MTDPISPELERISALVNATDLSNQKKLPESLKNLAPEVLNIINDATRYFVTNNQLSTTKAVELLEKAWNDRRPMTRESMQKVRSDIEAYRKTPGDETARHMVRVGKGVLAQFEAHEWLEKAKLAQAEHMRVRLEKDGSDAQSPSPDSAAVTSAVEHALNEYSKHVCGHYLSFLQGR